MVAATTISQPHIACKCFFPPSVLKEMSGKEWIRMVKANTYSLNYSKKSNQKYNNSLCSESGRNECFSVIQQQIWLTHRTNALTLSLWGILFGQFKRLNPFGYGSRTRFSTFLHLNQSGKLAHFQYHRMNTTFNCHFALPLWYSRQKNSFHRQGKIFINLWMDGWRE